MSDNKQDNNNQEPNNISDSNQEEVSIKTSSTENVGKTPWDVVYFLLSDWKGFPHLISIILGIGVLFTLIFWLVMDIANRNDVEMVQPSGGGTIIRVGKKETLSFLLSASAVWDSPKEFKVKEGEMLNITASGKVNLAIHHLVAAANNDTEPAIIWNDPEGIPNDKIEKPEHKYHKYRMKGLIVPEKCQYGSLVAVITKDDKTLPTKNDNPWCVGIKWNEKAPKSGVIWFAVNDVLLDENSKEIYEVPIESYKPPRKWADIEKEKYWDLFFDDNIGEFMITVNKHD
jgi:hypothetical protein